jgi:alginate O-acetyltransferase complex protein AlgI
MTPWETMLLAAGVLFVFFKTVTFRPMPAGRALGYLALWPGMDPRPFARTAAPEGWSLIAWGTAKMAAGAALLAGRAGVPSLDVVRVFLAFGLLFHLGLCDVLAGFWRRQGVPVPRLFDNPPGSRSLAEFWGRRWNRAFHEMVRDLVYRPVARRLGRAWGVMAAFALSGVLHETVTSLPARGGWGLPTIYFLLHGGLVLLERRWGMRGRLWTAAAVLAPLPLLFHPWFVRAIVLPLA